MRSSDERGHISDEVRRLIGSAIEQLPADGVPPEVRVIVAPNNRGNLAGGDQTIAGHIPAVPTEPTMTRTCFQCRSKTWRYSQHCIHCNVDLFAHDQVAHKAAAKRRLEKLGVIFSLSGISLMYLGQYLPDGIRIGVQIVGGLLVLGGLRAWSM